MNRGIALIFLCLLAVTAYGQDKPGPFASPDTKLNYLQESWEGRTLQELKAVWGNESSVSQRGQYQAYAYEYTSRVRPGISIFGEIQVSTGAISCTIFFEVGNDETIERVSRNGGGKVCWNHFRRNEPPE